MEKNKKLHILSKKVLMVIIIIFVIFSLYQREYMGKKYTVEDIENLTGTAIEERDGELLSVPCTECYSSTETDDNKYQQLEYVLFETPGAARRTFIKMKEYHKILSDDRSDFFCGTRMVCDACIHNFYLLRGNMLVRKELYYSMWNYPGSGSLDKEKEEQEEKQREKKFDELKDWVLNEAEF